MLDLASYGILLTVADHVARTSAQCDIGCMPSVAGPAAMFVAPDLLPDFSDIAQVPEGAESGAAAVVIGDMGNSLSAAVLNRALRLLMETPQPALISLGKTR